MDWKAIKTEYITTDTSYRKLAKKYGVSLNAIGNKSRQEGWVEDKEHFVNETVSKTIEKISEAQADRAKRIRTVADKLLDKVEMLVDNLEGDTSAYRQIAATLKDIKEIQMIKSNADLREQEARIANLQKQAEKDSEGKEPIRVIIDDGLNEYSK